jgi:glycosyltransferase involved in cell wall biosynthesis
MRIAMVGARFAGLDGVSLESAKVAEALERGGHQVYWFAGELGPEFTPGIVFAPASFDSAENLELQRRAFNGDDSDSVRAAIAETAPMIREAFEEFLDIYDVEAVIVQNAWAIPMQLPLAVAVADVVEERGIPTVGHHHDFSWERPRFDSCVAPEILDRYLPPSGDHIAHVVINSIAAEELQARRGLASTAMPNVMDFESGRPSHDGGARFRELVGIEDADVVLLQPTRVVRRKGIELTIELASRLDGDLKVIVSHPDDLDSEYWDELLALASDLAVDLRLVDVGRDRHALASAYAAADLVCFPSLYEGYGNALVEALYYRGPVMVNRYPVYVSDIAPLGLDVVEMDGVITDDTVAAAIEIVQGGRSVEEAVNRNFEIGLKNLSYAEVVELMETSLASVT